ncbi:MAG: hypothetical protein PHX04_05675 [Bacilli bacterium]|nr:hypothetical protein [Bacilli bacterium]
MSENTNTLFWIITGAVITVSVFLLISLNNESTLNKIFKKYDEEFKEIIAVKANYPLVKGKWKMDIQSINGGRLTYLLSNLSGNKIFVDQVEIIFYDCKNKEILTTFNQSVKMNIGTGLQGSSGLYNDKKLNNVVYCIDFSIT